MNIFFDMDQTLLGLDETLRPGTRRVLRRLKKDGHTMYVWSGMGIRWADVRQHGLESVIDDCFVKPLHDYAQATAEAGLPVMPDLVVDDFPEVPRALGGIWVVPYRFRIHSPNDDEMERVYAIILEYIQTGESSDEHFYPGPSTNHA